ASITVTSAAYAHALADSGTVAVNAEAAGFPQGSTTVTLTPSGFAWTLPAVTLAKSTGQPNFNPTIGLYALDPATLTAVARQLPRPGLDGSITLQNSNPAAISVTPEVIPLTALTADPFNQPGLAANLTVTGGG